MKLNKKGFSLVELVIVLTIVVIMISFWFSKMTTFFSYENTVSNTDNINKNFLKNKILSNYNNENKEIYFSKSMSWIYTIYENPFLKNNNINVLTWIILENDINISLYSDNILSQTWYIIVDDWDEISKNITYFNSSWVTNISLNINKNQISNKSIYIKDLNELNISWKLNIFKNSNDNSLNLNSIIWLNYSNNEIKFDSVKIILDKNWKNIIKWIINNKSYLLKSVKISFVDKSNNKTFLEFK